MVDDKVEIPVVNPWAREFTVIFPDKTHFSCSGAPIDFRISVKYEVTFMDDRGMLRREWLNGCAQYNIGDDVYQVRSI